MLLKTAILADLDNTLYNFVDYYVPCFRAMVHALSRETRIPEAEVINQFRTVYSKTESVEYPFSIQRLALCANLPSPDVERLAKLGYRVFLLRRKKTLKPYPGVKETLEWARSQGIAVVVVSNAPANLVWKRIWELGLKRLVTGVAAREGFGVPEDDSVARVLTQTGGKKGRRPGPPMLWSISKELLKPNPEMYLRVITDLQIQQSNAWIVGDSLHKDVMPALEIGAVGVWARYGEEFDRKNFETLVSITHWSQDQIAATYDRKVIQPSFTINSFSELTKLIPAPQPLLPLSGWP